MSAFVPPPTNFADLSYQAGAGNHFATEVPIKLFGNVSVHDCFVDRLCQIASLLHRIIHSNARMVCMLNN